MVQKSLRLLLSLIAVVLVTAVAYAPIPVNATTVGFGYLLLVLAIAATWGFVEAVFASVSATLAFNFFFLPPIGTFTIADPQNWVALFSFLATSLIASRLSDKAKRRAIDAIESQKNIERLYTLSRSILLIDSTEPVGRQLARKVAEIFDVSAAVLFDRGTAEVYRAGPSEFDGPEDQLRDSAAQGAVFLDTKRKRVITAIRLGSEPIASLGLQGAELPDSVLQGITNLVAIGLERSKAQDLTHEIEAARHTEQLRTTLIDAMAHEFKTPLTAIKAATTSLLETPDQPIQTRTELLRIADEEANHLQELIDDSIEMARLGTGHIQLNLERGDLTEIVREVINSLRTEIEDRPVALVCETPLSPIALDRRLAGLAIKQLLENALKYSPAGTPLEIRVKAGDGIAALEITDHGAGIPAVERARIFERFYRSPSVKRQIPGSGLGLSIAYSVARAHNGELTVSSRPGETTFRMTLPITSEGDRN